MDREPVASEVLRSVGYDPDTRVLEVELAGGAVYRYLDVPAHVHATLMTAPSHGQFYVDGIRNGGYEYVQVD